MRQTCDRSSRARMVGLDCGDWSGNAVTCKSTSAGAVQLGSHTIETWSVNQQMVSFSSAESEFYAIGPGSNTSCKKSFTLCRPTAMSR